VLNHREYLRKESIKRAEKDRAAQDRQQQKDRKTMMRMLKLNRPEEIISTSSSFDAKRQKMN
jgi:hypothetical protein